MESGEAGYFLTDAVVGLFILASVAGSLMGAFALARSFAERAEHSAKALIIAKSCIEESGLREGRQILDLEGIEYQQIRSMETVERGEKNEVQLVRIVCAARWMERSDSREVRLERVDIRGQAS